MVSQAQPGWSQCFGDTVSKNHQASGWQRKLLVVFLLGQLHA